MSSGTFSFRQFSISQHHTAMKVGTDGVLLGAWCGVLPFAANFAPSSILDIGTGTGLIALMSAQHFPQARLTAIEIDGDAYREACQNTINSPFSDRIVLHHIAFQDYVQTADDGLCFDLIVSNPPYYDQSLENPDRARATARHTSALSFRDLAHGAYQLLSHDGLFCVILPTEVVNSFCSEASMAGFFHIHQTAVKTVPRKAPRRHLLAFAKHSKWTDNPSFISKEEHYLQEADGSRSEWYASLTQDFYL